MRGGERLAISDWRLAIWSFESNAGETKALFLNKTSISNQKSKIADRQSLIANQSPFLYFRISLFHIIAYPLNRTRMKSSLIHASRLCAIIFFSFLAVPLWAQKEGPQRWEKTIRGFEKADRENPPAPGAVLFTGSSSIALWKDLASYFPDHRVLNRGFGGSNFTDLLYYADRVIMPYKPSMIFIYEGDNDIAQGDATDKILANAKKLRALIREKLGDTPVVFISPKPSVARWHLKANYESVNKALKEFAESEPNTEFADTWTPALDQDGNVRKDIFLEDNLHMNAKGYMIWQEVLSKYLPKK